MSYIYDLTDTWNAAGTTFAGIKMAVTNTASSATSKLLDISASGATTASFYVDKYGNVNTTGTLTMGSSFLRNRLINGAMQIWQRGTGAFTSGYTSDRWQIIAGTSPSVSRSTDVPSGFQYSMSVDGSANTSIAQKIEAVNCVDLSGATVTISFWAKQSAGAGANSLSFELYYANAADNFSAVTQIGSATVWTGSSSWTYYTTTFTGLPSGAVNGLRCNITGGSGATTTLITGVQFEVGQTATPFERRQYSSELVLCQRYYYRLTTVSGYQYMGWAKGYATTVLQVVLMLPVTMRVVPTSLDTSALNTFGFETGLTFSNTPTAITLQAVNSTNQAAVMNFEKTAGGFTIGALYWILSNNTSAYLGVSAEL